jgi:hypothetical protein
MWIPQPRSADKESAAAAKSSSGSASKKSSEVGKVSTETTEEKPKDSIFRPVLANAGAMATFVGAFDVTSKLTGQAYQCIFSHMWNGIATRHSDTIDTKFYVNGTALVLGLAHTAFVEFRDRTGRDLTDREASFIAAEFLRERLEESDERPLYDVSESDVLRLIDAIGIK